MSNSLPNFDGDLAAFHEIFDWLSLTETDAVAAACKRLQAIAGDYYQTYLSATEFKLENGVISTIEDNSIKNGLKKFIQKIRLVYSSGYKKKLWNMLLSCTSLKHITIFNTNYEGSKIAITKALGKEFEKILKNIESLCLVLPLIRGDLYDCLLKHCKKLKRFELVTCQKHSTMQYTAPFSLDWLTGHYPTFERFRFQHKIETEYNVPQLKTFFEKNSHIKRLGVDRH